MPRLPFVPLAAHAHLFAHAALATSAAFLCSLLSLPSVLLLGLHTYIHPDSLPAAADGVRAAIRRPSDPASDQPQLRRRARSAKDAHGGGGGGKPKPAFDEAGAQLLRLRLADPHLRTRPFFPEYRAAFAATAAALSTLLLRRLLPPEPSSSWSGAIPAVASLLAASHAFFALAKVSLERSATKKSERQLATIAGFLGFFLALLIRSGLVASVFDFGSTGGPPGPWGVATCAIAGCLGGFLFVPATRAARSLWLGTDQLRWNLEVVSCGAVARILLYVAFIIGVAVPLMWIRPLMEFPARNSRPGTVEEVRVWLLGASAALQLVVLRANMQTYLNEAVLSWYQRLHASKVPDLDFGRAKVFLHNHYLCLVAVQFFAAPALGMVLLGLSQMRGNLFGGVLFAGDASSVVKEGALFLAWWVAFVWAVYGTCTLVLLRWGFLLIS